MIRNFKIDINEIIKNNADEIALMAVCPQNDETEIMLSYQDVKTLIQKTSALIKNFNLNSGDNIMTILPNSLELAIIFLTCMYSGINLIPLPCETKNSDINNIFEIANPKLCFISNLVNEKFSDNKNLTQENQSIINIDGSFSWLNDDKYEYNGDDACIFISTSGTTGEPKLMKININKLWSSGYSFLSAHNLLNAQLRFLNYLPMSYLGGLFNLCLIPLVSKGCSVITETFNGRTYLNFWQMIERFKINAIWFTPSIIKGLSTFGQRIPIEERHKATNDIKVCFLGTAPINLENKINFEKQFNIELYENFALSETTFFTSETKESLNIREESSVGEKLNYVDIKLKELENKTYEILVKTPYLFDGYLTKEGLIPPDIDEEGYFSTCDLGSFNKNGTLIIQGRNRDIIKKGGYFISLREIELLAEQNQYVKEAAAVKIPHDFYGESYNLYLVLEEDIENTMVNHQILDKLIKYKWPEEIIIKKEFPRTSSGKIKKQELLKP